MNDKYNPPTSLTSTEARIIGQALVSDLSQQVQNLKGLLPDIERACLRLGSNLKEVREREITRLREHYDLLCKFVPDPLPFDFWLKVL